MDETWLCREEISAAHGEVFGVLERLLARAQETGAVRADIGAMDVMMLFKGACAAATALAHADPAIIDRHLDLLRASIVGSAQAVPLRGRTPRLEEVVTLEPGAPGDRSPAPGASARR